MMPRFYMHLNECGKVTPDPAGMTLDDCAAARAEALKAAREIMCAEIAEGRLCLGCQIDVTDEAGEVVIRVPFREAVMITGA